MMRSLIFSLFIFSQYNLWARDVVSVREHTDSKRTLVLNYGELDGLKKNELAELILVSDTNSKKLGLARAVKVYGNYSIWHIRRLSNRLSVERGAKIKLIRKSIISSYKRFKYKDNRVRVATVSTQSASTQDKSELEQMKPKDLQKSKRDNEVHVVLEKSKDESNNPVMYGQWVNGGKAPVDEDGYGVDLMYIQSLQEGTDESEIYARDELERYEQVIDNYISQGPTKRENEAVDWDKTYEAQKRDRFVDQFPERETDNFYTNLMKEIQANKVRKSEVMKTMESRFGKDWTQNMSDEELANFMKIHGIYQEELRRDRSIQTTSRFNLTSSMGFTLNSNTVNSDTSTYDDRRSLNYDLSFGGEYFLGDRYQFLNRFGLEASLRFAADTVGYELNDKRNAMVSERSVMGAIYFYPMALPNTVATNIMYVGLGFRNGFATLSSGGDQLSYSLSSVPTILGGFRYNSYSGIGFRIGGAIEPITVSARTYQETSFLPESITYTNIKLSVGLSYVL